MKISSKNKMYISYMAYGRSEIKKHPLVERCKQYWNSNENDHDYQKINVKT